MAIIVMIKNESIYSYQKFEVSLSQDFVILDNSIFNNPIIGDNSDNDLIGAAGRDLIDGVEGNDTIEGGSGVDTLLGGWGVNALAYRTSSAGVFIDLSSGQASGGDASGDVFFDFQNLIGSAHADHLLGDANLNILFGGDGHDTLRGRAGGDLLIGGNGMDWADYSDSPMPVFISLALGLGSGGDAEGDELFEIENLKGSAFNDTLIGNSKDNILQGGQGADSLVGGAGKDTADYSTSSEAVRVSLLTGKGYRGDAEGDRLLLIENLNGSNLEDVLEGSKAGNFLSGLNGNDFLDGGNGNDTLAGGDGADTLIGGKGLDVAIYTDSRSAIVVRLETSSQTGGDAEGDILQGIEHVVGSEFADLLAGDKLPNHLQGGGGNDTLISVDQKDTLSGGQGDDCYEVYSSSVKLREFTAEGVDTVISAIDWKLGSFFENLELRGLARKGTGNDFGNLITGNELSNTLIGMVGNDRLLGGDGNDTLVGGSLTKTSAFEVDTLTGGAGNDTFVLGRRGTSFYTDTATAGGRSSYAVITDYNPNEDILLLTGSALGYSLTSDTPGAYEIFESKRNDLIAIVYSSFQLTHTNTIASANYT